MYKVIRIFLFLFNPERIHNITFVLIKWFHKIPLLPWLTGKIYCINDKRLERNVFGLRSPNPVGLAAGFDKNADLIDEMSCFGFGFIEIGTVTPRPQDGNDQPRLFRLKDDNGIINRMGFNNYGADHIVRRLKKRNSDVIIGGNIGRNKITSNDKAIEDYKYCFDVLFPYVDYFVVNVSSPNTPGLRELQNKEPLTILLSNLQKHNNKYDKRKPILLKISPDLTHDQLDDIVNIVSDVNIDGVIATNTTIDRENLNTSSNDIEDIGLGGLSGKPLRNRSTEVIRYLSKKSNNAFPIIGVGGIHSAEDAVEKLDAGATLVQIYTGIIYEGPLLIKKINKLILRNGY